MRDGKFTRRTDSCSQPDERRRLVDRIAKLVLLAHRQKGIFEDWQGNAQESLGPILEAEMRNMQGGEALNHGAARPRDRTQLRQP